MLIKETGTSGVTKAAREQCQTAETSRRARALNAGPSHTSIGGKGKQGLLTSLPFWSLAQLGNMPKETLKQHLKLKPQLKQNPYFWTNSISYKKQDGWVNEHITNLALCLMCLYTYIYTHTYVSMFLLNLIQDNPSGNPPLMKNSNSLFHQLLCLH